MRLLVVESDDAVGNLKVPKRDSDAARLAAGAPLGWPSDVPVRSSVGKHAHPDDGLLELDFSNDDVRATRQVAKHAPEIEHDARLLHRDECVGGERFDANNCWPINGQGDVGEITKHTEPNALPIHSCVDRAGSGTLESRLDSIAECPWDCDQGKEANRDEGTNADRELASR